MTTHTQTAQTLTDEIIDLLITEHGAPADITADTAFGGGLTWGSAALTWPDITAV